MSPALSRVICKISSQRLVHRVKILPVSFPRAFNLQWSLSDVIKQNIHIWFLNIYNNGPIRIKRKRESQGTAGALPGGGSLYGVSMADWLLIDVFALIPGELKKKYLMLIASYRVKYWLLWPPSCLWHTPLGLTAPTAWLSCHYFPVSRKHFQT